MKSRHLYWLLTFVVLFGLFFAQKTAKASLFSATQNIATDSYTTSSLGSYNMGFRYYFNPTQEFNFATTTGVPFSVNMNIATSDLNPNWIETWVCYTRVDNSYYNCHPSQSILSQIEFGIRKNYTVNLNIPDGDVAIKDFYVGLYLGGSSTATIYGSNSDVFDGIFKVYLDTSGPPIITTTTMDDIYFYLNTPPPVNFVSINTISTSTTGAISFDWQYHLENATTSWGYYTIFPDWDLYKCDPNCDTKIGSNLGYNSHPNSNIATGTTAGFSLDNGNYQIKNFYLKYDSVGAGSITASTTKVNSNEFSISYTTPYIPIISWPTSTIASTTPIQITCDTNDPWYQYSLCKIGVWLFVPSQSVLNQFSNLTADISQKPPIGYFTSIKNALSGLTSSTPAFTINVSSTDPVATKFFTPIRTGLIWILWLAFAFWIFNRFRHFNFTNP